MRWRSSVVAALVALVVTALVAFGAGSSQAGRDVPPAAPSARLAQQEASSTPAASVSPTPEAAGVLVTLFVEAWLDPYLETRRTGLAATCTPRLAALLVLTDPARIPEARPSGPPIPVRETATAATYGQRLSDGTSIAIDVAADTSRQLSWIVTAVRPGKR